MKLLAHMSQFLKKLVCLFRGQEPLSSIVQSREFYLLDWILSLPARGGLVEVDFGDVRAEKLSQCFLNAFSNGLLKAPFFPDEDFCWERDLAGGG